MTTASPLDSLAGAFGHGVDRPQLNMQVATAQAMNGLRSAQTEDALLKAQNSISEQGARQELETNLTALYKSQGMDDYTAGTHAKAMAGVMNAGFGNYQQANEGWKNGVSAMQQETVGNPNAPLPNRQAADTALGHNPYQNVGDQLVPTVQQNVNTPDVIQTPGSTAMQGAQNAMAGLHNVQAAAGGFNPHAQGAGVGLSDPTQIAALAKAVQEQRLDPARINSRTAPILAQLELHTPGMDFNAMHADAALQSNAGFQQKAIGIEAMPTILQHMTTLGKGIGYSDNRTVGMMQKFMKGEFNDPAYAEYMAVRNDSLMKIASLMRGAGMSDQAHTAEIEAAAPTMSPLALDGWLKGQMSSLQPFYKEYSRVHHLGSTSSPGGNAPGPAPAAPTPPGAGAPHPTPDLAALAAAELARRGSGTAPAGGQ